MYAIIKNDAVTGFRSFSGQANPDVLWRKFGAVPVVQQTSAFDSATQYLAAGMPAFDPATMRVTIPYTVEDLPLDVARTAALKRLDAELQRRVVAGTTWEGRAVNTTPAEQLILTASSLKAVAGQWSDVYRFADGAVVPLTAAEMIELGTAVDAHIRSLYVRADEIRQQIQQAQTVAELAWTW